MSHFRPAASSIAAAETVYERAPVPASLLPLTIRYSSRIGWPPNQHSRIYRPLLPHFFEKRWSMTALSAGDRRPGAFLLFPPIAQYGPKRSRWLA
jgi:hypothetical protein